VSSIWYIVMRGKIRSIIHSKHLKPGDKIIYSGSRKECRYYGTKAINTTKDLLRERRKKQILLQRQYDHIDFCECGLSVKKHCRCNEIKIDI